LGFSESGSIGLLPGWAPDQGGATSGTYALSSTWEVIDQIMSRTACLLVVACSLTALPLMGCGDSNEKSAGIKGVPADVKPGEESPADRKKSMRGSGPNPGNADQAYPKGR